MLSRTLGDPLWWFTVVVAGVAINVMSAYLKQWIDRVRERVSSSARLRAKQSEEERQRRVKALAADPAELSLAQYEDLRHQMWSVRFSLYALGSMVLGVSFGVIIIQMQGKGLVSSVSIAGQVACMVAAALIQMMGAKVDRDAWRYANELRDAWKMSRSAKASER